MKREELKQYTSSEIEDIDDARLDASEDGIIKMTRAYIASEADKVMDEYEKRIKHLEEILDSDPRTNLRLDEENAMLLKRVNELEAQLENVQSSMYAENVDANMALIKANERIKELEAENAMIKAMKWISVDDVKPQWGKEVKVKFKDGSEDEVRFSYDYKWVSKGMGTCESSEVTHWMPLPATEKSSATEKENL